MTLHIGTSGWSYDHWQHVLYPPDTPVAARLPYYLQHFQTVEVNSTYYRWPADPTFARWFQRLPDDFRMTIKAPRGLPGPQRGHPAVPAAAELRLCPRAPGLFFPTGPAMAQGGDGVPASELAP